MDQVSKVIESDYLAFISYRHADNTEEDQQWANWLHHQLEVYDIPADLIGTKNQWGEMIPERIYPVFRDEISLPADANLATAITTALDRSLFLIVLCSPRAVQSRYVNEEILHFKRTGKQDRIMAALLLGEPNASIDDSKEEDPEDVRTLECFPQALQYDLTADGQLDTQQPTEPIAANFRLLDGGKGITNPNVYKQKLLKQGRNKADAERLANSYEEQLNTAKLKIIAGILGVQLELLTDRDKIYQLKKARAASKRFMRIAVGMGILTLASVISTGFAYLQWQRAEQEMHRAQSLLVEMSENLDFMNFDLRDVLDKYVPQHERVLVMQQIDSIVEALQLHGEETEESKWRKAVSLKQKADLLLQNSQLNPAEALPLYQQAFDLETVLLKENPDKSDYMRSLSITHGSLGDLFMRLGQIDTALRHYQTAMEISKALVKKAPGDIDAQADLISPYISLGDIFSRRNQNDDALNHYHSALEICKALVKLDPDNTEVQHTLSVLYERVGSIAVRLGQTETALKHYQSSFEIANKLAKQDPGNTQFQRSLVISYQQLGFFYMLQNQADTAHKYFQLSVGIEEQLAKQDPNNTQLKHGLSMSYLNKGDISLSLGQVDLAHKQFQSALEIGKALAKHDPDNIEFQDVVANSYQRIAMYFFKVQNYKIALDYAQKSIKKLPENGLLKGDYWSYQGACQIMLGDFSGAQQSGKIANTLSPELPGGGTLLAHTYLVLDQDLERAKLQYLEILPKIKDEFFFQQYLLDYLTLITEQGLCQQELCQKIIDWLPLEWQKHQQSMQAEGRGDI